jgi:hypothetical protein
MAANGSTPSSVPMSATRRRRRASGEPAADRRKNSASAATRPIANHLPLTAT